MKHNQILGTIRVLRIACKRSRPDIVRDNFKFSNYTRKEVFLIETFFARLGISNAQFYLGQCYDYGWGGQGKNKNRAVYWYKRAVKSDGHPRAAYNLAEILETIDSRQSRTQRITLLEMSAGAGDPDAMVTLGVYTHQKFKETGNAKFRRKFLNLYKAAAQLRHPSAFFNLYLCFHKGDGVRRNPVLANRYLTRAYAEGSKRAIDLVNNQPKRQRK